MVIIGVEWCHFVYSIVVFKVGMKRLWTVFSLTVPVGLNREVYT